jgi:hypothetical protein
VYAGEAGLNPLLNGQLQLTLRVVELALLTNKIGLRLLGNRKLLIVGSQNLMQLS